MATAPDVGDLKELRQLFEADSDEWREPRDERATDMRYLAGDPWDAKEKQARDAAGRPYVAFDELNQYVNQVVNDLRANPRAIAFAPAEDDDANSDDADKRAQMYSDKTREIEYRSNAKLGFTLAAENAIQGGYGFVKVAAKYAPKSVRNQELWIEPVPDPDSIVFDPFHLRPDGSDAKRAFELEHRRISQFKTDFPNAKQQDFDAYFRDNDYAKWVQPDRILLAKYWCVKNRKREVVIVQPPAVTPPAGIMDLRPAALPPAMELWADEYAEMRAAFPAGTKVLDEREADDPYVMWQLVNGVETLEEGEWPGEFLPIIPCYGRVLYQPVGGKTKRVLLSMIRLARQPYMSYCFYRTSEIENVGMTTKNPYWAYRGQLNAAEKNKIAQSMHEPLAVLEAGLTAPGAPPGQVLPLPQRNVSEPFIQALSVGAEETRRAIQAAIAANFLPSAAQARNEKSKVALDKIDQSSQKGTFHFVDHYEGMIRQTGVVIETAFDTFYDARRKISIRKADDSTGTIWINDPQNREAISVKGRHTVTVSSGPDFDSTREAASEFADSLLGNDKLMMVLGPGKAQQIAALAVKLKVRETGIGAIGEQIVDIIDPKPGKEQTPEQLARQNAELQQQVQQLTQMVQAAKQEIDSGLAKEREKTQRDVFLADMEQRFERMLQQLKGDQAIRQIQVKGAVDLAKQDDAQRHEVGLSAADAEQANRTAERTMLAGLAKPSGNGNGDGASA